MARVVFVTPEALNDAKRELYRRCRHVFFPKEIKDLALGLCLERSGIPLWWREVTWASGGVTRTWSTSSKASKMIHLIIPEQWLADQSVIPAELIVKGYLGRVRLG